jgi:Ca-activated chloride channel homolog
MRSIILAYRLALTLLLCALALQLDFTVAAQAGRNSQAPTTRPRETPEPQSPRQQPQQKPEEHVDSDVIKIDTSLVSIPVTALDRDGRYIPFLRKEDFRLFEDGVEQEIADFSPVTVPLHVVLLLDTSRSTVFKLEDIQAAAVAFVEQLRPNDQVMVVSFDSKVYVDSEFTSDRARLRRAIYRTRTGGGTKLYEAVDLVISERLARVDGRKAIVLFTDGVDTESKGVKARDTIEAVEESEVAVYPIRYNTEEQMNGRWGNRRNPNNRPPIFDVPWPLPRNGRRWPFDSLINQQFPGGRNSQWPRRGGGGDEYEVAAEYLQSLADRSGGRLYNAETLNNVHQAFSKIAEELRHQYALSYYPTNTAQDGTYRRVRVQTKVPNVIVRAREGYRAKGGPANKDSDDRDNGRPPLRRQPLTSVNP